MRRTARQVVIDFAELSDPGRDPHKQVNEDSAGYAETPLGHLAVVCDGMGGHVGGRAASEAAVRTILAGVAAGTPDADPGGTVAAAIRAAGTVVHALGGSGPDPSRPGATCVAALINERGAVIAHVGDSRVLLVHQGTLQRLTRDHSLVEELVAAGVLAPDQAAQHPEANKITRALGIEPTVEVELRRGFVPLAPGDLLLLVTDGVTDLVPDADLLELVRTRLSLGAAVLCQAVVELANARGGHDNCTIQALHVLEVPDPSAVGATLLIEEPDRLTEPLLPGGGFGPEPTRDIAAPGPRRPLAQRPPHRAAPTVLDEPGMAPLGTPPAPVTVAPPTRRQRTELQIARPLLVLGLALLVAIVAVAWMRHRRTVLQGEPPPALSIESAVPEARATTALAPVEEPPLPAPTDSGDVRSRGRRHWHPKSAAETPGGTAAPSAFE